MTTPPLLKHIPSIPYSDPPSRLQTLDVWLPRPIEQSDPNTTYWIIYIHGGAWRDPAQTSLTVLPTLSHLFGNTSTYAPVHPHIAGIASLNYRLSAYETHPTDPSRPDDAERNASHPQHVRDCVRALRYLRKRYGVKRWIGVGHSCGATLLAQMVAGIGLEVGAPDSEEAGKSEEGEGDAGKENTRLTPAEGPTSLVLLAGIYSIPLLLSTHSPPTCPPPISAIYTSFIAHAFGPNTAAYLPASPISGTYTPSAWPSGRLVVLCHSYGDELVERAQRDVMVVALDRAGWGVVVEEGDGEDEVGVGGRVVNVRDVKGGHDEVWEEGGQIARLLADVVGRLCA
ncbi:hypothetical protein IQ07DRAFT_680167 [Pyrenochaeta sp. DS3sAY3a]|nr:hypothetical protein IQ07DRAFT_680167 [Pyrenochaeta sp. DS3sAY3a]